MEHIKKLIKDTGHIMSLSSQRNVEAEITYKKIMNPIDLEETIESI